MASSMWTEISYLPMGIDRSRWPGVKHDDECLCRRPKKGVVDHILKVCLEGDTQKTNEFRDTSARFHSKVAACVHCPSSQVRVLKDLRRHNVVSTQLFAVETTSRPSWLPAQLDSTRPPSCTGFRSSVQDRSLRQETGPT